MKARMAGKLMNLLKAGMGRAPDEAIRIRDIAGRFGPDAAFGVLAATQTPGDAFDKATAFAGSTLGGGGGGLLLSGLTGNKMPMVSEMAGSFLGDYAGMHASEALQRGKDKVTGGEGLSAYERMGKEQQDAFAEQLKQQILTQYGLIPGTREQYAYGNDQGLGTGVL